MIKCSGNKSLSILGPISTPDTVINQASFLSIGLNNTNIGKSDIENAIAVDSIVGNKRKEKSNRDIKVGLEVQSNITTTVLVSH